MYNTILDIWPTTLTYNPNLAKVNLHAKYQGRRPNGSAVREGTDGRTDRRMDATKYIISFASRSIMIGKLRLELYMSYPFLFL